MARSSSELRLRTECKLTALTGAQPVSATGNLKGGLPVRGKPGVLHFALGRGVEHQRPFAAQDFAFKTKRSTQPVAVKCLPFVLETEEAKKFALHVSPAFFETVCCLEQTNEIYTLTQRLLGIKPKA